MHRASSGKRHLQLLPDTDFDTGYFDIRHVSWDGDIEIRGNCHSVPGNCRGHPVTIRILPEDELRFYSNEQLVTSHRLRPASSGWQKAPEHHTPVWQQVMFGDNVLATAIRDRLLLHSIMLNIKGDATP